MLIPVRIVQDCDDFKPLNLTPVGCGMSCSAKTATYPRWCGLTPSRWFEWTRRTARAFRYKKPKCLADFVLEPMGGTPMPRRAPTTPEMRPRAASAKI